jgi:phosphate-selective porin OprO/OprP
VNKLIRYGALAAFVGVGAAGVAHADSATTTGGIKIKSDDGNFEAVIGGRIHFDGAIAMEDQGSDLHLSDSKKATGLFFRRVFLSLGGKLYGWEYHIDDDLSAGASGAGFNDVWISHAVFGNDQVYIGQHKPWRSLDEMASNNNLPLMERNILSANGIYGGRDYTQGLYYRYTNNGFWAGTSLYDDTKASKGAGPSYGANARVAFAPIVTKTEWFHVGLNYSFDNANGNKDGYAAMAPGYSTWYAKNGAGVTLVSFGAASGNNVNASTAAVELAGVYGPAFVEAEYGTTHQWEQANSSGATSASVQAYSVTAAYALTGESRPYDAASASYGGIRPNSVNGAWEVAVRYDHGKNKSLDAGCGLITKNATSSAPASKCSVSSITGGVN